MRRICGRSPQRLAGTPIFHRFSKDNFQHESASLFFTRSLDLWLRMRWKWRCIVKRYSFTIESKENHLSFFFFFFIFKRFQNKYEYILKCTSLREIYSKLSTSRQILEFNRILQIIERFKDFLVPIYHFETPREKKERERKASEENFSKRKSLAVTMLSVIGRIPTDLYYWNYVASRRGTKLNAIQPRDSRNFVQI